MSGEIPQEVWDSMVGYFSTKTINGVVFEGHEVTPEKIVWGRKDGGCEGCRSCTWERARKRYWPKKEEDKRNPWRKHHTENFWAFFLVDPPQ